MIFGASIPTGEAGQFFERSLIVHTDGISHVRCTTLSSCAVSATFTMVSCKSLLPCSGFGLRPRSALQTVSCPPIDTSCRWTSLSYQALICSGPHNVCLLEASTSLTPLQSAYPS
jgi:hypothetical protein